MTATLISNIGELVTNSDKDLGIVNDAALVIENGKVIWAGSARSAPSADAKIDADGGCVTPGFVDSHTHLIFAGDRSKDYEARMSGGSYASGGINTTVAAVRNSSDDELRANAKQLVEQASSAGTTTLEIKSGYGLNVETEARVLRIAREFTDETTFLGAHLVPKESADNRNEYIELVKGKMLDACAPHSRWIDVFCDKGAFTVDEAREVLQAGIAKGLKGRIHGNQLGDTGGADLAAELGLASVDHCTHVSDKALEALAAKKVVATLLPGAEFFTRSPYPDARRFLQFGVTVALASDCNPGSSFLTSMPLVMALAIREMHMNPKEALYAATKGGAMALQRDDIGHLIVGSTADLVIWDAPSYLHIPYRMGEIKSRVFIGGDERI
ncbi:MAG: imidazolonepropionase [Actinobacteria bacterium]|nr:imidazolonepropionase [Actinomycetota bacterium]